MQRRRSTRAGAVALGIALAFTGLALSGPAADAAKSTKPVKGGTLTYVNQTDSRTLDPAQQTFWTEGAGQDRFFNIFGALLIINDDGVVEPFMAASIDSPDKGTTWVLKLRPGLEFSDNTPLDAEAVKFNWDRVKDPAIGASNAANFATVASYTVTDTTTLTLVLTAPNAQFPFTMTQAMSYIGSPTAIRALGPDFGSRPVGAGPFILKEYVRGDHATFTPNPTYFRAKDVNLSELIVRPVSDETQKTNAYTTGAAQVVWTGQNPTVAAAKQAGAKVTAVSLLGNISVMYNVAKPPFNDPTIMKAFTQAMDRSTIAKTVWGDTTPLPPGIIAESASIFDSSAKYPKPNLAAAQKAVDAYTAKNGPIQVGILYSTGNQAILDSATSFQQQLQRLEGVTVQLTGVDQAALVTTWRGGNWTMTFNAISSVAPDPTLYNLFHTGSVQNFSGYSNPAVDAALEKARATTDPKAQQAAWSDFQKAITADGYYPGFHNSQYFLLANPEVQNLQYFGDSVPRMDLVWLGKASTK